MGNDKLLEVKNVKKYFQTKKGLLHAVDDVSFDILKGETLGIVGESGCGKSTTGRVVLKLLEATAGEILFEGENILTCSKSRMRELRKEMQIVFQDPFASLNPRMSVAEIISEPLIVNKVFKKKQDRINRVKELMSVVGLAERLTNVYPHELDGGRRQRIGIARALALKPKFIVQDEPVSALDVSIQAQILNLMADLQDEFKLTYMFISHDLNVVKHVSDRIAVMYLGKVVEMADYDTMFRRPMHPYTQALLSAIPIPRLTATRERVLLEGDVPSPIEPPDGCRFYGRCMYRQENCLTVTPELRDIDAHTQVACHYAGNLEPRTK